jgi:hypothetical protein
LEAAGVGAKQKPQPFGGRGSVDSVMFLCCLGSIQRKSHVRRPLGIPVVVAKSAGSAERRHQVRNYASNRKQASKKPELKDSGFAMSVG